VKLRHPSPLDLDTLVEMGRAAHAETWYASLPYDPERTRATVTAAMEDQNALPLVVETSSGEIAGFMIGVVSNHLFSSGRYACDLVLYVSPRWRGTSAFVRMVRAYEAWCRIKRVDEIILGHSSDVNAAGVPELYRGMGYEPNLRAYRKKCVWPPD
jgi:GNAT superfamily N-acetyltransferase